MILLGTPIRIANGRFPNGPTDREVSPGRSLPTRSLIRVQRTTIGARSINNWLDFSARRPSLSFLIVCKLSPFEASALNCLNGARRASVIKTDIMKLTVVTGGCRNGKSRINGSRNAVFHPNKPPSEDIEPKKRFPISSLTFPICWTLRAPCKRELW